MFASLRKFIFTVLFIAILITAIGYGLFLYLFPQHFFPYFPAIPAFVLMVSVLVHAYLIKATENNARTFASKYLGAIGLKMFIYLVFIVVFLVADTTRAVPFLISFLVTYAAFTLYEVMSILNFLKKGNNTKY